MIEKFIAYDSPEYFKQLTDKFRKKFEVARKDQRFEPLVIVDKNIPGISNQRVLIIQLYTSFDESSFGLLEYDLNQHILEMSLRLLTHLEDRYSLYRYLKDERIVRIVVTTSPSPKLFNNSNKWAFDTADSLALVKQLLSLKKQSRAYYDSGLNALVNDSK